MWSFIKGIIHHELNITDPVQSELGKLQSKRINYEKPFFFSDKKDLIFFTIFFLKLLKQLKRLKQISEAY